MKKVAYIQLLAFLLLIGCSKDDSVPNTDTEDGFKGQLEWVKSYGGSGEEEALSIVETSDNSYVLFGYTQSTDGDITDKTTTDSDFWAFKVSAQGELIWSKTYGGTADDRGQKLIQTQDGGYAMVGYSRSNDGDVSENAGLQDYWMVKTDSAGNLVWEKTFGFSGIDRAFSIVQTQDGGYFITGFLDVTASGGEGNDNKSQQKHGVGEFWGIKLDVNGEIQWRRYFGGTDNDRSYDTIETEDGGFLMIGSSESTDFDITNSNGSYDFWIVKVNSEGTKIWEKSYGGTEIDIAYAITSDGSGRYLVIGDARSNDGDITDSNGNADLWAIQIDGNGNLIWEKSYGGTQFDTGRGLTKASEGFFITGNSRSNDFDVNENKGQSDIWTLWIDRDGETKWKSSFGGSEEEFATGIIETSDKKIVIAGSSSSSDGDFSTNRGGKDAVIIKYN